MEVLAYIISAVVAYLLGGINCGIIITKAMAHQDIRKVGSGNAGATNVLRILGLKPALITLLGDFLKAVVAVALAMLWFKLLCPEISNIFGLCTASFFVVLGHMHPAYFGFKGGKGVITFAGSVVLIHPILTISAIAIFAIITAITKYVSLGSIISVCLYPVMVIVLALCKQSFGNEIAIEALICALPPLLITFKHRSNIVRLFKGTENKLNFKKSHSSAEPTDVPEEEPIENDKGENDNG